MYSNYAKLQQLQLPKQPYYETQSTYLLVYAPGRSRALEATLEFQLHRKFRLVSELGAALTPSVAGVVVVAEDVEFLSTTLSYFAHALQEGADFAACDAVFGFEGDTALYRGEKHLAGARCAVLSRELLEDCRAAGCDPAQPGALLTLAASRAKHPQHIPQALLRYRREISAGDIFGEKDRRALLLSHELNMTGAPIVAVSAVPILQKLGYEVAVLGPSDGGSLPLFVEAGASVVTNPDCVNSPALWGLATGSDFVLANTVVEAEAIRQLNGAPVPVLWWLHDAFAGYSHIAHRVPKHLEENIHLCAVGTHATAAMHSIRPGFFIRQLIYGLPDYSQESFGEYDIGYAGGRPLFVNVGAFEPRKGQDILVRAIRLLPEETRRRAAFLFVGKGSDKALLAQVRDLTRDYPQEVFYVKRLERPEIKSLMAQCACVVCSSRDDPMPTFVTEGLIFGKPSIVSEHTGTAGLVTEGVDGFIYRDDDPEQLAQRLQYAIDHPEQLAGMRDACRTLYDKYYSPRAFEETLTAYVQEFGQPRGE